MSAVRHVILALSAATLSAQSPLVTTYGFNGGGPAGGQLLFDLSVQTTQTVWRLDVHSGSPPGTAGTVEVYLAPTTWVGNETNPNAWTLAASGPVVSAGTGLPSSACMTNGIVLLPGSYGVAVRHVGLSFLRTNGNGSNQTYSTQEMTLTAGASQNVAWSGTFQPRVFNGAIHYQGGIVSGPFVCATAGTFGSGCGNLTMNATTAPLLGVTATLQTSNIPSTSAVSVQVLSFTQVLPGIDLGPAGAPGCFRHVTVDSVVASPTTGVWSRLLPVPATAALLGAMVYGQSASFVPGVNALGVITSNGIELRLGNVIG